MCLLHSACTPPPPLSLANFSSTIVLQSSWEDCIFPKGYENNTLCLIWKANRVHYGGFENSQWEGGGHPSHLFITTYLTKPRRRWQRERKKKKGFMSKTTTLHVYPAFLYISLSSLHNHDVKSPNFKFT